MSEHKIVLLTGSSGELGTAIVHSNTRFTLLKPSSNELDITNQKKIKDYFNKYNFSAIIHCAAMARMGQCEKNPMDAIKVNIIGTANLVNATIMKENIRFIHISSDGVYYSDRGNYKENDETIPYNIYGWTKLGSETAVRILKDYSILRTSFFEPDNIPFHNAGVDVYSSKLPINEFAKAILFLVSSEFNGVANIGHERKSDYERYKKFKPSIKKCTYKEIQKGLSFIYPKDSSMNISLWRKIKNDAVNFSSSKE